MKNKERKIIQSKLANDNIKVFYNLLNTRFCPQLDSKYIFEIQKISQAFNIRLTREQKLKFCKKCLSFWTVDTRQIRFDSKSKTKEYICKKCSYVRRFKY